MLRMFTKMIIAYKTSLTGQWFGSRYTIADKESMCSYRHQAKRRTSSVGRNGLAVDGEKLAIDIDEVSVKPYFFLDEYATLHLSIQDS